MLKGLLAYTMLIYRFSARHWVNDNRKNPFVVYLLKTIVY
jgi:hypothetical protein